MLIIKQIHDDCPARLNPPLFIFKRCPSAAQHNAKVLESHNFELNKVIQAQHPSQISYGSEFRPSSSLKRLLSDHPLWPRLKSILDEGATFPLQDVDDDSRHIDLQFHLERGNHKSLTKFEEFIDPVITEDIQRGFALPLPIEILPKLSGVSLAPPRLS